MKKMLKSSVVLMLAMAVGLMLNVGCEDSELSRLLGLSKKKNDAVVQPQETSSRSAVENAEETATNNGLPQNQISENVGGIQPLDIALPSGKNYIKVLQISGNRNPNDLGYAGTWEYFDPTPVGTEVIRYDTQNPANVDEVGNWAFLDTDKIRVLSVGEGGSGANVIVQNINNESITIYWQGNRVSIQGRSGNKIVSGNDLTILSGLPIAVSNYAGGSLSAHISSNYLIDVSFRINGTNLRITTLNDNTNYINFGVSYYTTSNAYTSAQENAKNTWRKAATAASPTANRVNNWGRTK